ncbi:Surfactin synthase thioesterase subunit [Streptomyces sp. WMMB 714]|uniref:thioesterase II family protein n=1 Tax=Streptomyces sp. WMMB 714 TaxID=1286822 RepID=UPI0005F87C2B|nr:alpha/beta fold hydrolase [Streptomyces sp. WMMB 714]SCK33443.1 Surfactin synthase thioesterase subunit [Streptomyces sp. WMMB 714]
MTTAAGTADPWIRRYHPAPNAPFRLVCMPHAGGSASFFHPLSQALARKADVVAVQYPGRQDRLREKCLDDVRETADRAFASLWPLTGLPMVLFGHSMGASVAFEVARRMEDKGLVPVALFVSGRRAPSRHRDEGIHLKNDDDFLAEIRALDGTDASLLDDPDIRRMVLPGLRADYKAAETYRYRPGPPLKCPVVAMVGDSDLKAPVEDVRAWSEHTSGAFELETFPGGHFYLGSRPRAIAEKIQSHVAALTGQAG